MLETLVSLKTIYRKPYMMFVWAYLITVMGILLGYRLPLSISVDPGFISVVYVIIPSIFLINSFIRHEERIEEKLIKRHKGFWGRHERDIIILLLYFGGMTAAFAVSSFMMPDNAFKVQLEKISQIRGTDIKDITGQLASKDSFFMEVLMNNLSVMLFSFFFSLLFGAGAVFILVWNASILGVYIGSISKDLWNIPLVGLAFIPHGVPEIGGYIAAGLAGGILSFGMIRRKSPEIMKSIFVDSMMMLTLAVAFIAIGAGIEAYL